MSDLGYGLAIMGFWLFMGASCVALNLPPGDVTNHWDYKIATEACGLAGDPK